jgi:hypothetical protein
VSVGVAIVVGAVVGLVLGVIPGVTTDLPLAPEAGVALGAWDVLTRRDSRSCAWPTCPLPFAL